LSVRCRSVSSLSVVVSAVLCRVLRQDVGAVIVRWWAWLGV
jgi:hypothetical protein